MSGSPPRRRVLTMAALCVAGGFVAAVMPGSSALLSHGALVLGMTFAMTEISIAGISPRAEVRPFVLAFGMSYVVLSGLILAFAVLSSDPQIRNGWVLMAAVPPAIAVVPITSILKGDTRRAVIALALLYVLGLGLVPAITLVFTNQTAPFGELVLQTVLLIGIPLVASRF